MLACFARHRGILTEPAFRSMIIACCRAVCALRHSHDRTQFHISSMLRSAPRRLRQYSAAGCGPNHRKTSRYLPRVSLSQRPAHRCRQPSAFAARHRARPASAIRPEGRGPAQAGSDRRVSPNPPKNICEIGPSSTPAPVTVAGFYD